MQLVATSCALNLLWQLEHRYVHCLLHLSLTLVVATANTLLCCVLLSMLMFQGAGPETLVPVAVKRYNERLLNSNPG